MPNETQVTLIGRLTADPELRSTPGGGQVVNFTIATNPRVRDRQSGEWSDGPASFHDCEVWQKQAEHVTESLTKGSRVIASGSLQQIAFTTKEGENRRKWVVKIEDIGPSLRFVSATLSDSDGVRNSQPTSAAAAASTDPWA